MSLRHYIGFTLVLVYPVTTKDVFECFYVYYCICTSWSPQCLELCGGVINKYINETVRHIALRIFYSWRTDCKLYYGTPTLIYSLGHKGVRLLNTLYELTLEDIIRYLSLTRWYTCVRKVKARNSVLFLHSKLVRYTITLVWSGAVEPI